MCARCEQWLTVDCYSSRIVNLIVAVLMVLGGISQFFPIDLCVFPPRMLEMNIS